MVKEQGSFDMASDCGAQQACLKASVHLDRTGLNPIIFLFYMDVKDLHSRTGRNEKKGKTQEKMERGSRKRSSSAGSEKMDRVGGR